MCENHPGIERSDSRKKVLFVCTGNTCRSPLAEAILKKRIAGTDMENRLEVFSAGLHAPDGQPATLLSREVAHSHGLYLDEHLSRALTCELIASAGLIIVMQKLHKVMLQKEISSQGKEIRLLGEFLKSGGDNADIHDPFGGDRQTYESCFDEISRAVDGLFEYLTADCQNAGEGENDRPGPVLN